MQNQDFAGIEERLAAMIVSLQQLLDDKIEKIEIISAPTDGKLIIVTFAAALFGAVAGSMATFYLEIRKEHHRLFDTAGAINAKYCINLNRLLGLKKKCFEPWRQEIDKLLLYLNSVADHSQRLNQIDHFRHLIEHSTPELQSPLKQWDEITFVDIEASEKLGVFSSFDNDSLRIFEETRYYVENVQRGIRTHNTLWNDYVTNKNNPQEVLISNYHFLSHFRMMCDYCDYALFLTDYSAKRLQANMVRYMKMHRLMPYREVKLFEIKESFVSLIPADEEYYKMFGMPKIESRS